MSYFGKLKNVHNGPPAPPRRTDINKEHFGWPQDEFDDEEGDMYEVPPCALPDVSVSQRPVEENIYLEKMAASSAPQRLAAPPPRPGKPLKPQQRAADFNNDSNNKKPPKINRNDKPARKMIMPPPPVRSSPAPLLPPNTEEDVYLDPNEQEDNDDLYLEPAAAYTPPSYGPVRMPPSPKTTLVPSHIPMMKPPVPRAKSNSFLSSMNEVKTAPSSEPKCATFTSKLPPLTPSIKPLLPASLKEAKACPPNPSVADTKPVVPSRVTKANKKSANEDKEWFAANCNRKAAEDLLMRVNKDGTFLIRNSSAQNAGQPYTLAVLYQEKVYNIPIRFLEDSQGYALGKEGKKNEEIFTSLDEMISHHKNNQLFLIDSKSKAKHTAYLTQPARP